MKVPPLTAAPLDVRMMLEEVGLKVLSSPVLAEGQLIAAGEAPLTVGRSQDTSVSIDDPRLSRRHAQLVNEHGRYVLVDLDSKNGTWVNGARTSRQGLRHGDSVRVGSNVFLFVDRRETATERVRGEIRSALACVGDNLRQLQRAIEERTLTHEEARDLTRDCLCAARRLEQHARSQLEQPGDATPVVTRAVSRASHV